ncbi:hypothetical protein SAMN04487859_11197 [Roseovarius lutimaris]|uniref:DUF4399 domain-containing protein n=1 Tax=Roseovarius lutimaris TaxID=1005928 RepID=A0A1I5D0E4_9RHOB|nr:hypothetical protein [Roseovarius lutimaris]SFN92623.1 hypothetical protein SAMN04487859_11197 [Roseovarius lutimaris]
MPKPFAFLLIGLFFGVGFGFLLAATTGAELAGHDHAAPGAVHDHAAHDHSATGPDHGKLTDVTGPAPQISLALHPDGPQSRNLHIEITNFTFAPEAVNGPHVPGQGHAHIYLNGVKIARTYGPWFQLDALPSGRHDIRVTLNANDHSQLADHGTPIEATAELVIE